MEIIHLILGKGNPQRMNGVNKVVNELATHQKLAGQKVEVWGITAEPVHDYPARAYITHLYKKNKNPFALDPELKHYMLTKKRDTVFHFHGGFIPVMYSAAMWLRQNNIPFVFTPHGSYNVIAMQKNRLVKMIYFILFERPLLKAAMAIHSLGKSEITGLQSIFKNNKSVLIPYGFEPQKQMLELPKNPAFIVGYCGRLDVYTKGLKELLEGFNLFFKEYPNTKLWIIGDGPEKETLVKIAQRLQLGNGVVFCGAKYGLEKDRLLQQCSVFAAPSRNEGLPTAVLEAASMGIPCLVTEATNTGEYIRQFNAGLVMAHTSSSEISQGLKSLFNQIQQQGPSNLLGENARRMVTEAFDWALILNRFQKLYQV